ncbi:hypothetical protein [Clostridium beijerinckii]|uniref:Uncharacterized protein n=1 Tax=Clostridium beijerinckii TaxID=1520 RepID=A0A1S8T674_CLOBE|nr:hypothetical protein [Clostridium beijerinckii]MBA8934550.1 hypothetical protein [Clostridium beijerinckii]NRT35552.1 hypothetical protein [Clostridium beijerinckii]NRT45020.1 hypothetical protein [Clostridium beijerinckii]NRU38736.1 hypothetical protein [Clostridium beijerinckii]NRZ20984.1 hypothetical protein [Clostridium beijerinckii]
MNEEEIIFNKLLDLFKNNSKRTPIVLESANSINTSKEKIRELTFQDLK